MEQVFKDIYVAVWKEVFGERPVMPVEEFEKLFTLDLALPLEDKCSISGVPVWVEQEVKYKKYISNEEVQKRNSTDNWVKEKKVIGGMAEVLAGISDIATFRASRSIESDVLAKSDQVNSSSYVYNSAGVHASQKILWCRGLRASEYVVASRDNANCSFVVRVFGSGGISSSFDIHWSGKCSHSYFCNDCFDLRDCMFCFHLVSKQYCIGNMQFEEAEYKAMKEKLLNEYFEQLPSGKFKGLADL